MGLVFYLRMKCFLRNHWNHGFERIFSFMPINFLRTEEKYELCYDFSSAGELVLSQVAYRHKNNVVWCYP
jgi:hypothetical protein